MGVNLKILPTGEIDAALQKYGVPEWAKPYLYKYIKENPLSTVKFAASFIDTKRKRGAVTKTHVILPNGKKFRIESIVKVLNLFYFGEDSMSRIAERWTEHTTSYNKDCIEHFSYMSSKVDKHKRAIKNLIEGLGYKVGTSPPEEISEVFDYIAAIDSWDDRTIVTSIILRDSYVEALGKILYKVFYPVSPEFMRLFGKAFSDGEQESQWGINESRRIIASGEVDRDHLLELTRNVMVRIFKSIHANMDIAEEGDIVKETTLLGDIAIAYPFHTLSELGLDVDVESEVKLVKAEVAVS